MRVVIQDSTLKQHRACSARFESDCPWWDKNIQALVYEDWDQAVEHYLTVRRDGVRQLKWLVRHKLVPMTETELATAIAAHGGSHD